MVRTWDPEVNESRSKKLRGRRKSPEHRAHMSAAHLKRQARYEHIPYEKLYEYALKRIEMQEELNEDSVG